MPVPAALDLPSPTDPQSFFRYPPPGPGKRSPSPVAVTPEKAKTHNDVSVTTLPHSPIVHPYNSCPSPIFQLEFPQDLECLTPSPDPSRSATPDGCRHFLQVSLSRSPSPSLPFPPPPSSRSPSPNLELPSPGDVHGRDSAWSPWSWAIKQPPPATDFQSPPSYAHSQGTSTSTSCRASTLSPDTSFSTSTSVSNNTSACSTNPYRSENYTSSYHTCTSSSASQALEPPALSCSSASFNPPSSRPASTDPSSTAPLPGSGSSQPAPKLARPTSISLKPFVTLGLSKPPSDPRPLAVSRPAPAAGRLELQTGRDLVLGGWLGCGRTSGMLGMLFSAVGNCMRTIEPAQRNLIDEPEMVHEAREDMSPSSLLPQRRAGVTHEKQISRAQGPELGGARQEREAMERNRDEDICIIEEYCDAEEELPQRPTHSVPGVHLPHVDPHHGARNYNVNTRAINKNTTSATTANPSTKLGKIASAVKGSATRRPLVLLIGESLRTARAYKRSKSSSGRYEGQVPHIRFLHTGRQ
ncbi:nascent polypeptide-associated complex subunit alpha, muscle-specific form-like [Penaeus japonicus]|uniref:nascent polypeptide-associated complex subunit alpha, muscle-specific form-like n=1 Tax=Penaeus japonicus TaxID=27405 RepID=UPI001C710E3D|nr:nascent polypeptide-associated complex subunit alpha, muscle-specific form-like [Penaeus japonicus]XP_042880381.1 nascent polypeptide-associated complex subunit alpha, muscle-specific form-like [Penaeus japonicus]XP_042880382.1 nascent polypeptide-associated complex subunit alpha, muscle-specific form-like [Penaeus japonicus]XP_042880383.1 nascent polypeptide-associated complex subunit alpha, muscle-specific form-like [Penaeus japonicus]XP_042880384.1 nascent polypeptide-associated complex s